MASISASMWRVDFDDSKYRIDGCVTAQTRDARRTAYEQFRKDTKRLRLEGYGSEQAAERMLQQAAKLTTQPLRVQEYASLSL